MLNSQDHLDKKILQLNKQLNTLYRNRYTTKKLDHPIQKGWRRFHVLTPKAKNRADSATLIAILEVIGYSRWQKHPVLRPKYRKRSNYSRLIEIEQPVHKLSEGEWKHRKLPEAWRTYFDQETTHYGSEWRNKLVFKYPYVFELKIEPNWVSELRTINPEIEHQIQQIEQWLQQRNLRGRLDNLVGNRKWRWVYDFKRQISARRIAEKEIRLALGTPSEVDLNLSSLWQIQISFRWGLFFSHVTQWQRFGAKNAVSAGSSPAVATTNVLAVRSGILRSVKPCFTAYLSH